ncbi:glycosyltransferase family 22, partial [Trichoderma cornu-damae]
NVVGIDSQERYSRQPPDLERRARDALGPTEIYLEDEPTVPRWIWRYTPGPAEVIRYLVGVLPLPLWICRYNIRWLFEDIIAGITIGLVLVPQSMAYATLAHLSPAHGLYTSFAGVLLYWLFGTSKDVVVGATAVGSLLIGQSLNGSTTKLGVGMYTAEEIAHTLTILSGVVLVIFGALRLGWTVEFIPQVAIAAFTTAASITIIATQLPAVLGLQGINTQAAPHRVFIETLRRAPHARVDAVLGISTIVLLSTFGSLCSMMEKRQPARKRLWSFISTFRLPFAVGILTLISYIINHGSSSRHSPFRVVGKIPSGFQRAQIPTSPSIELIVSIMKELPAVAIIMVIGQIAVTKSMARSHGYSINPSQELVALGAINILSPFAGGYLCTSSFGVSAILSKAGSRTPLAGLFGAAVLFVAINYLTRVFSYTPSAALAGVVVHSLYHTMSRPKTLYKYWQVSPIELLIWLISVAVALMHSLEWSIYSGILLTFILVLTRIARTPGRFLGVARVQQHGEGGGGAGPGEELRNPAGAHASSEQPMYFPLNRETAFNSNVRLAAPYPGVFVYRLSEGFSYINQSYHLDTLFEHITKNTKRMADSVMRKPSERLWNEPPPKASDLKMLEARPYFRAVVLDFNAVNNVDVTSVQGLIDLRSTIDRYTAPDVAEWHFANVHNHWTRRALAVAGFGYPTRQNLDALASWTPLYSVAPLDAKDDAVFTRGGQRGADIEASSHRTGSEKEQSDAGTSLGFESSGNSSSPDENRRVERMASMSAVDRPFFHIRLRDAVDAAVRNARVKDDAV